MSEPLPGQSSIFDVLGAPEPPSAPRGRTRTRGDVGGTDWHRDALSRVTALAGAGATFQAFDLAAAGVPEPDNPRRWGALFSAASRLGIIRPVGDSATARPGGGHHVNLWTGAP